MRKKLFLRNIWKYKRKKKRELFSKIFLNGSYITTKNKKLFLWGGPWHGEANPGSNSSLPSNEGNQDDAILPLSLHSLQQRGGEKKMWLYLWKISVNTDISVLEFYEYIINIEEISVDIFTQISIRQNNTKLMKLLRKSKE